MAYEHTRKNYAHGIVGRVVQDDEHDHPSRKPPDPDRRGARHA